MPRVFRSEFGRTLTFSQQLESVKNKLKTRNNAIAMIFFENKGDNFGIWHYSSKRCNHLFIYFYKKKCYYILLFKYKILNVTLP